MFGKGSYNQIMSKGKKMDSLFPNICDRGIRVKANEVNKHQFLKTFADKRFTTKGEI